MSPAMAVKKPKHRSTGNTPTNPRLATGEVIIVGGDTARRAALKAAVVRVSGPEVKALADLELLKLYIHPRSTGRAGRPPVRGFLLDWELGKPRGAPLVELLKWLGEVYPRTPVVTYTGAPDLDEIRQMCAGREHEIWPVQRTAAVEPLRYAALAAVHLPPEKIAVLARDRLTDAVLRAIEETWFEPWDEQRLAARAWLLDQLPHRVGPTERHLRTIEAYFETVKYDDLCGARGVGQATMTRQEKEVGEIWGEPIDSLKQRWERHCKGRGTGTPAFLTDAMRGADETRNDDSKRPPGPRRPSARRSR